MISLLMHTVITNAAVIEHSHAGSSFRVIHLYQLSNLTMSITECCLVKQIRKGKSHLVTGTITFYVCVDFQEDALESPIHAVLGGPEPDVDSVAATLCLALHLSQVA